MHHIELELNANKPIGFGIHCVNYPKTRHLVLRFMRRESRVIVPRQFTGKVWLGAILHLIIGLLVAEFTLTVKL